MDKKEFNEEFLKSLHMRLKSTFRVLSVIQTPKDLLLMLII